MKQLSELTPAETWLILHGEKAALKNLLKYTFLDLLLKQVLVVKEVQRQSNPRDPVRTYKYIMTGVSFQKYTHKIHEIVFLSPFIDNHDLKMLFQNLVKISYQKAESDKAYYTYIIANKHLKPNFRVSFYQKMVGGFTYSKEGLIFRDIIRKEVAQAQEGMLDYMTTNKEKAIELGKQIGGNIFLLEGIDSLLAKEVDSEFLKEMSSQKPSPSGCSTTSCGCFVNHSDSFDSSCSADSHSSSDGGSDCSSCSSCGGCGGD